MLYLFGQLLGHGLDFVPGGHGVCTPGCVEENERHLCHTPESLHLGTDVAVSENKPPSRVWVSSMLHYALSSSTFVHRFVSSLSRQGLCKTAYRCEPSSRRAPFRLESNSRQSFFGALRYRLQVYGGMLLKTLHNHF